MYFKLLGIIFLSYYLEKALNDSICRHFVGLMWLDRTAPNFTESDLTGAFSWIELYSNWWHRAALGCTSLVSAGMDCARHCAPDWYTLHCTSVGGTGLDSTALHCCSWLILTWVVLDGNTLQCTCMDETWLE